ncbi:MAG: hypothetical protein WBC71_14520 [Salaquimonas sp.]
MLNEKSPGSVWNVAFVAVAIFVGAMAFSGVVSTDRSKTTVAANVN